MNEMLTLAIAPLVLWVLLIFLRVRGVSLILSILVGKLFAEELSQKAYETVSGFTAVNDIRQVQLALLLLPVVLNIILTRSKTPKSKVLINALALLLASITLILFALPYTNLDSKIGVNGQNLISSYQSYVICAAGGLALLLAWYPDIKSKTKNKHK